MPSLIDFRRRIRSVKNTQQITKAMKMVSAAKLRRAQERVIAARPYTNLLHEMLKDVAAAAKNAGADGELHPLLAVRPEKRILIVVVTSDRGLAGAFSVNVAKGVQELINARPGTEIFIEAIGRKGRDYFRRRGAKVTGEHVGIVDRARFSDARNVAASVVERYANGEIDAVYVVGNEFKSVISQKLSTFRMLPLAEVDGAETAPDFIIEGDPREILRHLLPRYVETIFLRIMLESAAAEHAARMTAMESATNNARDVIDKLTLHMNRVRQASITKEIIEVVSGAQAQ